MNMKRIIILIAILFIVLLALTYIISSDNNLILKFSRVNIKNDNNKAANTPNSSQEYVDESNSIDSKSPPPEDNLNKIPDSELAEKTKSGWELTWNDEFNTKKINENYWTLQTGEDIWGNNELQYYTNRSDNCIIKDGMLIIKGLKEKYGNSNYTSARIATKNKVNFLYGKLEIKAKFPKGNGLFPAIWLLPCEDSYNDRRKNGEIDLAEMLGNNPKVIYGVAHYSFNNKKKSYKKYSDGITDYSEGFHVYSIEWDSQKIDWLIDDKVYFTFNFNNSFDETYDPFNKRFYLIINLAIGGDWPGYDLSKTDFPSMVEIDYIRYYRPRA